MRISQRSIRCLCGLLVLSAILPGLLSCERNNKPAVAGFYFWRTTFAPTPLERKAFRDFRVRELKTRFFDVVKDASGIHPTAKLRFPRPLPDTTGLPTIRPVVFLRQSVFDAATDVEGLARDILFERDGICRDGSLRCVGLELDCDWTRASRQGFFLLAKVLGDSLHRRGEDIRSTLRLHQFSDPDLAGVPPVDRATLMAYNMGAFTPSDGKESILDLDELGKWLGKGRTYPKPLDVALPLWSWTIQIRDGKPVDLLQETACEDLVSYPKLTGITGTIWQADDGFFAHGHWIRKGDRLKCEAPTRDRLICAAKLLADRLPPLADREVVYFDVSERTLRRHDSSTLARILRILGVPGGGPRVGVLGP